MRKVCILKRDTGRELDGVEAKARERWRVLWVWEGSRDFGLVGRDRQGLRVSPSDHPLHPDKHGLGSMVEGLGSSLAS